MACLPAKVFVWLDELKAELAPDDQGSWKARRKPEVWSRGLNLDLLLSAEEESVAFEGFGSLPTSNMDIDQALTQSLPLKPQQRTAAQDAAILSYLIATNHDPKSLPKNLPGKPGVKAEVRTALGRRGIWAGNTVFDKAWERLAKAGDIGFKP